MMENMGRTASSLYWFRGEADRAHIVVQHGSSSYDVVTAGLGLRQHYELLPAHAAGAICPDLREYFDSHSPLAPRQHGIECDVWH